LLPSRSPIQPLVLGEAERALAWAQALRARGILVPAIRPPTVPRGSARLRITLSAAHEEADVDRLLDALAEVAAA
jgi:8-amino-7-oxononanoate synthase